MGVIAYRIHSENSADEGSAEQPAATAPVEAAAKPAGAQLSLQLQAPVQAPPEQVTAGQEAPTVSVVPKYNNKKKVKAQPLPRQP